MKYLRKMFALVLGIAFFAALIICVGRIFAIKNININMITYEEDSTESYIKAKEALNVYKGESILFLREADIIEKISGSNYVVTSCEKKYPCTINVTIKERVEIFAVSVGGRYSMYDGDGGYLRTDEENANAVDGTPNVEVTGIVTELTEQMGAVADIAASFKANFGGLRSIVKSINLGSQPEIEGYRDRVIFNLRCGLVIQLIDYHQNYEEMLSVAYKRFCKLSDKEKLNGTIRVQCTNGEISIGYNGV